MSNKQRTAKDFFSYYQRRSISNLFRWVDWKKKSSIRKYLKNIQKNTVIVEVGPGAGNVLADLTESSFLIGLEPNQKLLSICRKKGFVPVQANAEISLPFSNESVDVIVTIDAIEHIQHRNQFFRESYRILKNGGKFIAFTPPYDSLLWIFAEKVHNILLQTKSDHISPFTKESMNAFLEQYFTNRDIKKMNLGLTMVAYGEKNIKEIKEV